MNPMGFQPGPAKFEALYVHVPFCFHKCHYCDFYSITRQSPERMEHFVDLLLAEAHLWSGGPELRPQTVFFGGGTPSLLPLKDMQRLLSELKKRFDFSGVSEWTIEANPATVTADYCAMLRGQGVDRLSFGAQSFSQADLSLLERHHEPQDVPHSLALARAAGFARLNVDLIYAIPGQTMESWLATLEQAIALGTEHVSCYGLTYESNTPLTVRKRLGQFQAASEELELAMLHATRRRLSEAGLHAYEISNFAAPAKECRHNLHYWNGGNYLGLGPSAASHFSGTRWRNKPHLGEWETAVAGGQLPTDQVEHLTPLQRAGELAMLQLRLSRGVNFADFEGRSGLDARTLYAGAIEQLCQLGLLCVDEKGFALSQKGLNVADAVAAEFVSPPQSHP
jgi:oxygen-independent coproporphyrinogen-3 oxidase